MKKITLSLFGLLIYLSASAQYEPDVRYLQKHIWQSIIAHDSLVYSSDSGSAFMTEESAIITAFPGGLANEILLFDQTNLLYKWDGVKNGTTTIVYGIDVSGTNDTDAVYNFYKNTTGQDSVLVIYTDDGSGNLIFDIMFEFKYDTSNRISNWLIHVDIMGNGSLTVVNDYVFHYNNNLLDSVNIVSFFGTMGMEGKLTNTYDANGRLIQFDVFGLDANDELVPEDRYFFKHNAQDEIIEVIELYFDSDNSTYDLNGSWKYLLKQNSNIGIEEDAKITTSLYPNPAKDVVRVKSSESFDTYSIVSLMGKVVQIGDLSVNGTLNVKDLTTGIYMLNLKKGSQTEIVKFRKL